MDGRALTADLGTLKCSQTLRRILEIKSEPREVNSVLLVVFCFLEEGKESSGSESGSA